MDKSAINRAVSSVKEILPKTLKTCLWLVRITVLVTLGVLFLEYFNILPYISEFLSPVFNLMGLPGEAALAYVSGYFVNVYSAIAVMATLNLDIRTVTILAAMILAAHNMITETAVQKKTGSSAVRMVLVRTISSLIIGRYIISLRIIRPLSPIVFLKSASLPESPHSTNDCKKSLLGGRGARQYSVFLIIDSCLVQGSILIPDHDRFHRGGR